MQPIVLLQESDVEQWQSLLNATSPITSSSLVLMRGPGVPSDVLTVRSGSSGGIEKQVLDAGERVQRPHILRLATSIQHALDHERQAHAHLRPLATYVPSHLLSLAAVHTLTKSLKLQNAL